MQVFVGIMIILISVVLYADKHAINDLDKRVSTLEHLQKPASQ